jgi:D-sedoheptulose 7-phosphate isomerase
MRDQFEQHQRVVSVAMQHIELLERIADRIIECFNTGGKLFVLGNGGSAADAQHIAAELVGRFKHDRKALPAVALTTDTSILTAVANDIGAEDCFVRQVEALVGDRDVVWALSVSGTSPNVIRAMKRARAIGATTIGFTGRSGGELKGLCELCFLVDHDTSDRVQEVHELAYHTICDRIERTFVSSTL